VETAVIFNPSKSEEELLQAILDDLGIASPAATTRKALLEALNAHLLASRAAGRRVVLIFDEAQNLSPAVLEQVRLLSNLETEREKLIQIILVGQVELSARLGQRQLRQLNQRVTVRYRVSALSPKETRAYIQHRLSLAGAQRHDLFTTPALRLVHRRSGGVPRVINVMCDRALMALYARRLERVTRSTMALAVRSIYPPWDPMHLTTPGRTSPWRIAAALAAALIGATVGAVVRASTLP